MAFCDGGCLCGAVRYRLGAEPITSYVCHCTDCQRRTGSAFALSLVVPAAALEVTRGSTAAYAAALGDGRVKRGQLCAACGSRLWGEPRLDQTIRILQPGTLDEPSQFPPVAHIWARSAQPWFVFPEGVAVFAEQPKERLQLARLWQRRHGSASSVRRATASDAAAALACVTSAFEPYVERIGKPPGPMLLDYPALVEAGHVWVAELAGNVEGVLVQYETADGFYIDTVATSPAVRGTGMGRTLLQFAEGEAVRLGFSSLYLCTNSKMTENQVFYPKIGYVEYDRRRDAGYDRVFYRKSLA
jgi:GNAT superfamily N-acetyltransferase